MAETAPLGMLLHRWCWTCLFRYVLVKETIHKVEVEKAPLAQIFVGADGSHVRKKRDVCTVKSCLGSTQYMSIGFASVA